MVNKPMSPVRATWVPPQSSRLEPMSSTRTVSPYFSPNSIMAPVFWADSMSITRACVAALATISAFTRCSISRICASVTGALCVKSKRVLSASTSEPFCCTWSPSTSRNALCIRWVTEWLRMVRRAAPGSTWASTASPTAQRALMHVAVVAEHIGLDLLRVDAPRKHRPERHESHPRRPPDRRSRRRTASCPAPPHLAARPSARPPAVPSRYSATTLAGASSCS